MMWWLDRATAAVDHLTGGVISKGLNWGETRKQLDPSVQVRMHMDRTPIEELPFQVIEKEGSSDDAFIELVGMSPQQGMMKRLSSMASAFWHDLDRLIRTGSNDSTRFRNDEWTPNHSDPRETISWKYRQRVAFVVFSGEAGSGKTAHARALGNFLQVPCVLLSSQCASFVAAESGRSMICRVLKYCEQRGSAVLLLDEIDSYVNNPGLVAEIRQAIDGAIQLGEDHVLYIVATTNKDIRICFPTDLLDRVVMHISFDRVDGGPGMPRTPWPKHGWDTPACLAFWKKYAGCLSDSDQKALAKLSKGYTPRILQLWVQKVCMKAVQESCMRRAREGGPSDWVHVPALKDFLVECPHSSGLRYWYLAIRTGARPGVRIAFVMALAFALALAFVSRGLLIEVYRHHFIVLHAPPSVHALAGASQKAVCDSARVPLLRSVTARVCPCCAQ